LNYVYKLHHPSSNLHQRKSKSHNDLQNTRKQLVSAFSKILNLQREAILLFIQTS
jgi:hypothetical protein